MSRYRSASSHPLGYLARIAWLLRWGMRLLLLLVIADLFYLAATWPDWRALAKGPVPKSNFIMEYEKHHLDRKNSQAARWQPVTLDAIPKHVVRAVILAEDSRFYQHSGFDLIAFKEAMNYNWAEGKFKLGASTISQQTVKNLFLNSARNPLRKWHELILTWGMEQNIKKRRILEIYLNVAEFGPGIYGAQAAALAYWGVPVSQITVSQAAELAATLPSPAKHNPATRTQYFEKRARKILNLVLRHPGEAAQTVNQERFNPRPPAEEPLPPGDTI